MHNTVLLQDVVNVDVDHAKEFEEMDTNAALEECSTKQPPTQSRAKQTIG